MRTMRILILLVLVVFIATLAIAIPPASAGDSAWETTYWNNRDLDGSSVLKRDEEQIDHDWGDGSPDSRVNDDDFSARWVRTVYFNAAGTYRFSATMDDGMRVWIDDALVIDSWTDSQVHTQSVDLYMSGGDHAIKVEYYEAGGKAVAKFNWIPVAGPPPVPAAYWQGQYFNNMTLTGPPVFVRADAEINFDWKMGSPWPTVNSEQFSARWTRSTFANPGQYQFDILTDDGVRLWVNGQLLIDQWHTNQSVNYSASALHPSGSMNLRLDYFENEGAALINLKVTAAEGLSTPQPPPPSPQTPSLPEGSTAVVTNAQWVNVRSNPESGDNVISAASRGEIVTLLGRNGGWIKVRQANSVEGWIGSSYLASNVDFASLPVLAS